MAIAPRHNPKTRRIAQMALRFEKAFHSNGKAKVGYWWMEVDEGLGLNEFYDMRCSGKAGLASWLQGVLLTYNDYSIIKPTTIKN